VKAKHQFHCIAVRPVRTDASVTLARASRGLILATLFLLGCASSGARTSDEDLDLRQARALKAELQQPRKPVLLPLAEQLAPLSSEPQRPARLYTLSFRSAPMGEVVAAVVRDTELNLAMESEVDTSKPVTVSLKNVTLEEALEAIVVNGAGMAWTLEKGTLTIRRFIERIYHFDAPDIVSQTEVDVGGDMLGSGVEKSGVLGKYQVKSKRAEQVADIWLAIEHELGALKSKDGVLRFDRNAGIIYMADAPGKMATMVRFLDSLSTALNRQVYIDARILEVTLTDQTKLGIDWTKLNIGFKSSSRALPEIFELGFNTSGSINKSAQSSFKALLDFLKTQGEVRTLSNPSLTVMNRKSAVLTVGYQFPYADVNGVDRDARTGLVTVGSTIRRAVLGLQLGITAQIGGDGLVTFHIVPTLTRIQRQVDVDVPLGFGKESISNPVIDLQELATTVRVRDGRPFVLAGLISKIRSTQKEGLPWLGDLPLVGGLFRHSVTSDTSSELVIFVTPYVVPEDQGTALRLPRAGSSSR
jgi:hypothetical protein